MGKSFRTVILLVSLSLLNACTKSEEVATPIRPALLDGAWRLETPKTETEVGSRGAKPPFMMRLQTNQADLLNPLNTDASLDGEKSPTSELVSLKLERRRNHLKIVDEDGVPRLEFDIVSLDENSLVIQVVRGEEGLSTTSRLVRITDEVFAESVEKVTTKEAPAFRFRFESLRRSLDKSNETLELKDAASIRRVGEKFTALRCGYQVEKGRLAIQIQELEKRFSGKFKSIGTPLFRAVIATTLDLSKSEESQAWPSLATEISWTYGDVMTVITPELAKATCAQELHRKGKKITFDLKCSKLTAYGYKKDQLVSELTETAALYLSAACEPRKYK